MSGVAVPLVPLVQLATPTLTSSRLAEGKTSVNAVLVNGNPPLLVTTIVMVDVAPTGTVVGLNVLVTAMGADTVSGRLNDELVRPRVLPMAPAAKEFV